MEPGASTNSDCPTLRFFLAQGWDTQQIAAPVGAFSEAECQWAQQFTIPRSIEMLYRLPVGGFAGGGGGGGGGGVAGGASAGGAAEGRVPLNVPL